MLPAFNDPDDTILDTRLLLIDYGTNLEVLIANLLLSENKQRKFLLQDERLQDLHSFRCIVQLAHSAAPKVPQRKVPNRKGVQLTKELESHIDQLRRCATCYNYDEKSETYIFDFLVDDEMRIAFNSFWNKVLDLYTTFHKLSMLNDLVISKRARERFKREVKSQHFATRLPEPQDEDKVFRFEQVKFFSQGDDKIVGYVSLSDGEHQLIQLLGTFCMVSSSNVLFLLDEPESHFNPQWRVKFITRLLDMPTQNGIRREDSPVSKQDCLLTTHAPFVPSDMSEDRIFIFSKHSKTGRVEVRNPDIKTYGSTFDSILEECFGVRPPISEVPLQDIEHLMKSDDTREIKEGMERLGYSMQKVYLADRLRQLSKEEES